jgi:hypothetical protein
MVIDDSVPEPPGPHELAQPTGPSAPVVSVTQVTILACHGAAGCLVSGVQPMTSREEHTMDVRLDFMAEPSAGKALKHLMSAGKALRETA